MAWGDDGELTYGELSGWARQVAALLAGRGVRAGDAVAVTVPKGADQVAAVLGVLAAGGVYVPVGVDQPPERRDRIYRNAGAWWSSPPTTSRPPAGATAIAGPGAGGGRTTLAYVIYTSGSTGEPKGVEVTHRAAVNTIDDINDRFGVGPARPGAGRVGAGLRPVGVRPVRPAVGVGGTVVLVDEADRREARRWVELVRRWRRHRLEQSCRPCSTWPGRRRRPRPGRSLRLALVGGDWVGLDLPDRLRHASARLPVRRARRHHRRRRSSPTRYEVDHVAGALAVDPLRPPAAQPALPGRRRPRPRLPGLGARRAVDRRRRRRPRLPRRPRTHRRRSSSTTTASAGTAPATSAATGPTARWSSSAASTTRSRSAATASSSARSRPRSRPTPDVAPRRRARPPATRRHPRLLRRHRRHHRRPRRHHHARPGSPTGCPPT